MIKKISFHPRYVIENTLLNETHLVISITDTKDIEAKINGASDLIRINFLDIEDNYEDINKDFLFDMNKANKIINFVDKYNNNTKEYNLLVHCEAGVSRSAAIALSLYKKLNCEFEEYDNTNYANKLVVSIMSKIIGKEIIIPNAPQVDRIILLSKIK